MKFEVEMEVVLKFWREPPAYCNHFLNKIEGFRLKVVPESEVKDVADVVGLEEVGDGGPVVIGLDVAADVVGREFALVGKAVVRAEDVVEVGRRSIAFASFSSTRV